VRLMFGAGDRAFRSRARIRPGEHCVAPPAIASVIGKVGIDCEIVPAVGKGVPVVERSGLGKAIADRRSRGEDESVALELLANVGQAVGRSWSHALSLTKRAVCSRANRGNFFRATGRSDASNGSGHGWKGAAVLDVL